tara:strand:+ start:2422 stop:3531 length:1110 start_codon:yes stop_codon:yes gene_type:complete
MDYHNKIFTLSTLKKLAEKDLNKKTRRIINRQELEDAPGIQRPALKSVGRDVEKEFSKNLSNKERILAEIRRRKRANVGEHTSHKVEGRDKNEYARKELGLGIGSKRKEEEHYQQMPNGYSHQQSFSSVKVASPDKAILRKIRSLKAHKIIPEEYRDVIQSDALIIGANINDIPMVAYPNNDSPEVVSELNTISVTIDETPLTEDTMELADEEPLELFKRACHALGVEVDNEIVPLLVQDLRRIAVILKYVHLRPRPFEVAPYHGIALTPSNFDPLGVTPSYPSVHSTIGYGLANFYADTYPEHAPAFMNVGDTIALQRIQSGQHFPSDNQYAKLIADTLFSRANEPSEKKPAKKSQPKTAKRRIKILK